MNRGNIRVMLSGGAEAYHTTGYIPEFLNHDNNEATEGL